MANLFARASLLPSMTLDIGPFMKLDAAARLAEEAELDLSNLTGLQQSVSSIPPSFNAKVAGQLAQLALTMRMTGGEFNLFDPIKLREQLDIMAGELNRRASRIQMMSGLNLGMIANLGFAARVKARLKLEFGDMDDPGFMDTMNARLRTAMHIQAHKPQIAFKNLPRIHLIANLPKILEAAAEAEIDVLDPPSNVAQRMSLMFRPIMGISLPDIQIKIKAILAAAATIDAVTRIEEEFGEIGSNRLRPIAYRLEAMAALGARLKLPPMGLEIPLPLPEEIRAGEEVLSHPLFRANFQGFRMPTINILPMIQAYIALRAVLSLNTKIEPMEHCIPCGT